MKILKLLNKKNLSIILSFFFLFILKVYSNEPVDIWNIEPKEIITENSNEEKTISTNTGFSPNMGKNLRSLDASRSRRDYRQHHNPYHHLPKDC